jgi:hypothetical protein
MSSGALQRKNNEFTAGLGNTPSDVTLVTGEHTVRITVGGKEWTRTVQITTGEIHLHAEI